MLPWIGGCSPARPCIDRALGALPAQAQALATVRARASHMTRLAGGISILARALPPTAMIAPRLALSPRVRHHWGRPRPPHIPRAMDPKLLELLVCPVTKGPLTYDREAQELISRSARLAYPVRDGIPVLLETEARPLSDEEIER